jgi:hypothetical protein
MHELPILPVNFHRDESKNTSKTTWDITSIQEGKKIHKAEHWHESKVNLSIELPFFFLRKSGWWGKLRFPTKVVLIVGFLDLGDPFFLDRQFGGLCHCCEKGGKGERECQRGTRTSLNLHPNCAMCGEAVEGVRDLR